MCLLNIAPPRAAASGFAARGFATPVSSLSDRVRAVPQFSRAAGELRFLRQFANETRLAILSGKLCACDARERGRSGERVTVDPFAWNSCDTEGWKRAGRPGHAWTRVRLTGRQGANGSRKICGDAVNARFTVREPVRTAERFIIPDIVISFD